MSPLADFLHEFRMRHNIRQMELAEIMGYEQTYISALELDKKGPPTDEFIENFTKKFNLSSIESSRLIEAADASKRKFEIPIEISKDAYWLIKDLRDRLPTLTKAEIDILRKILSLQKDMQENLPDIPRQIKRRKNEARL